MLRQTDDEITIKVHEEKFCIIECASDSTNNRHKFKANEDKIDYFGKTNQFHSVFLHSPEIIDYFNNHTKDDKGRIVHTLEGYSGTVWTKYVLIDFDIIEEEKQEDLIQILQNIRNFLRHLESAYELELNYIRINFSGRKGFHVRIPSVLFGGFEPSQKLPQLIKQLVKKLVGSIRIDESFYHHIGLFRFVNSRNSKSGLCAIPLTAKEIFALSIEEIKALAKNPRRIEYISTDELVPNPELVKLKEQIISKPKGMIVNFGEVKIPLDDNIWLGVAEGSRNKGRASIVGYLIRKKIPPEHILTITKLWNNSCRPPEDEKIVTKHVESLIKDFGTAENTFWTISEGKVSFSLVEFRKYLEGEGFAKSYLNHDYMFIQIKNNRIREVSQNLIKDHVLSYIRSLELPYKEQIEEMMLQRNSYLLGENLIECISTIDPELSTDTKDKATFFFNNTIVEITAEVGITEKGYKNSAELVWESHIIGRDFALLNRTLGSNKSDFEKFLFNISGRDEENFRSFQTAIGYLLHSYKDSSMAKVIVLCDQKVTEFPDGRTGKSLFGKALSRVKRSVRIDGKNFDFGSRFTFQQVDLDTQILEFNDVKKDFDFENLFSVVTDDMTIENKGQRPFQIPFDKSPKILASTNFTINGLGSSYRDRLFEIEFSDFYNEQHRPLDDFGKRFFDEWEEGEWNKFYNFMFECVMIYLREGLISPKNQNLQLRKIIDATSREFVEFMNEQDVIEGFDKKILCDNFHKSYPDYMLLKQNTFSKWLKSYCNIKSYKLNEVRSNGKTYISIIK